MQSRIYTSLFTVIVGMSLASSCDRNEVETLAGKLPDPIHILLRAAEKERVSADQSFAFSFFENVFDEESLDKDRNFMVSPLSLSMALAMTLQPFIDATFLSKLSVSGKNSEHIRRMR